LHISECTELQRLRFDTRVGQWHPLFSKRTSLETDKFPFLLFFAQKVCSSPLDYLNVHLH
ncbi:hypothetical protein X975_22142, partial [Stegodyphus mimosarum]